MIVFLEQLRFLLWIAAIVFIVRWFHLFSYRWDESDLEARDSRAEEASPAPKQDPSASASPLFN